MFRGQLDGPGWRRIRIGHGSSDTALVGFNEGVSCRCYLATSGFPESRSAEIKAHKNQAHTVPCLACVILCGGWRSSTLGGWSPPGLWNKVFFLVSAMSRNPLECVSSALFPRSSLCNPLTPV